MTTRTHVCASSAQRVAPCYPSTALGAFAAAVLVLVACGGSDVAGNDGASSGDVPPSTSSGTAPPPSTDTTPPKPPPLPTVTDLHVAEAKLATDGSTTIALSWTAIADATSYRMERAPNENGKPGTFASLGTSPSATAQSFQDTTKLAAESFYRVVVVSAKGEAPSEPLVVYPIVDSRYSILGQPLSGAPFNVEISAEVRYPRATTKKQFPLVLMLHGNHAICTRAVSGEYCPSESSRSSGNVSNACSDGGSTVANHKGYVYLLDSLAARGYVAVSIDANALTCRNSSNAYIAQRSQLVLEHLRRWKTFSTEGGPAPLGTALVGAVDLAKVGLMGHSRGGDAVSAVPELLADDPIAGVTVKSVLAVAPTDFSSAKPSGAAYSVLLPLCDGDVWDDRGMSFYDAIRNDPARTSHVSQILFGGANHNYFNDTWSDDDNDAAPTRSCDKAVMLGDGTAQRAKAAQRAMLSLLMSDWYGGTVGTDKLAPFLRGEGGAPAYMTAWAGTKLDLRVSYSGPRHRIVDDFTAPGAPLASTAGGTNTFSAFDSPGVCGGAACDDALAVCTNGKCNGNNGKCTGQGCNLAYQFFHESSLVQAVALSWQDKGARASIDLGNVDASSYAALSFRIAAADSPLNPSGTAQSFGVRVTDGAGKAVDLSMSSLQTIPRLYAVRKNGDTNANVRPPKEVLQTVRIAKSALAGLALNRLAKIELVMNGATSGAVFLTDVELSD